MRDKPAYRRLLDLRLGGRRRVDADMDLEIESHVAMRAADLVRAGMSADEADAEARRRFGDFDRARRQLHGAARQRDAALRHRDRLGSFVADVRYAMRQARRAPGFTALAVATLAIGIGATTTMFTLVDHILLRALPFPHAEQLVALTTLDSARNSVPTMSTADWIDYRTARSVSVALRGFPIRQGILTGDSALKVSAARVSANYFDVVGARFVAGRAFTESEIASGAPAVAISERLWRELFNADPRLAAPLRTAVRSYTVVGVVAPGQEFPAETDVWFPMNITPAFDPIRVNVSYIATGRLAAGATPAQAAVELSTIARRIRASDPAALYAFGVVATPLADAVVGADNALYLKLLMGVVGLVLLIVCANVAAAGLARGAARSREMAIRTSLGANRWSLIRQLLIEHVWLGMLGGALGLFVAWLAVHSILSRWGGQIPRANEVSLDARVFVFTFGAALAAGLVAGLVPALRVSGVSPQTMLVSGGRTAAKGGRNLAGASLVSAEIALALLLLTGAGLLIRSFRALLGRDIGLSTNVATAEVGLSGPAYATDTVRRYNYWNSLLEQYRAIPGVRAVAVANWIPLGITGGTFIELADRSAPGAGALYRSVSDDFFAVLEMRLLIGRTFDVQDGPGTPRVVVINHKLAATYWPGENPVGKLMRASSTERQSALPAAWLTIVGVVNDLRTFGLESDPRGEMYVLYRQTPWVTTSMTALVRSDLPAAQLLPEMKRRARAVDPRLAADVGTIANRLRNTLAPRVLTLSLLTGFSALALLLAALGVYGVLSYAVAQRTRELAVRAALGAQRGQLLMLVARSGLRVVVTGILVGLVAALLLTRTMTSMLVDVTAGDPWAYAGAVVVLFTVALAAIVVPARRATKLDPIIALQAD